MITYCFKFHPPFLSPEVLSVCRLSLSIVNLLAVPLLSAASALAVHVRSAGLMPTAKGLSAAATLAVHVRNRFALPDSRAFALSVFLMPTAKGPKNLRFSGPAGAFTCIGSVCRCNSRSARPKSLRSSGLAGVRPISFSYAYGKRSEKPTVFRTRWRVHMHRIRLPLQASASASMHAHFCLCVHYTPCREVFQSLFFIICR